MPMVSPPLSEADPVEEVESGSCSCSPIGSYSTVRSTNIVQLDVQHDSRMTLTIYRAPDLEDTLSPTMLLTGNNNFTFEYTLHSNCTITLQGSDPVSVRSALGRVQGDSGISFPIEFFPSFPAIRVGFMFLDWNPSELEHPSLCGPMYAAHYLGHISGITIFVRVLDEDRLVLGVVLPVAGCFNDECSTSVLVPYSLDDGCKVTIGDAGDQPNYGDLKFIRDMLSKVAKIEEGSDALGEYVPELMQIQLGTLTLNIDSSYVQDFVGEEEVSSLQDFVDEEEVASKERDASAE